VLDVTWSVVCGLVASALEGFSAIDKPAVASTARRSPTGVL
jgi:hypothetical protein